MHAWTDGWLLKQDAPLYLLQYTILQSKVHDLIWKWRSGRGLWLHDPKLLTKHSLLIPIDILWIVCDVYLPCCSTDAKSPDGILWEVVQYRTIACQVQMLDNAEA